MTLPRIFMVLGMVLLLVGLISGISSRGENAARGMTIELGCLAMGAGIFYAAQRFDRRRGS